MQLDANRATSVVINNDGLNYVPTNKYVLFGHHFAAIAGANSLVGPVLTAQVSYLPGTVFATIPIALIIGIYMRYIRPGKVGEVSFIGVLLLITAIWFGGIITHNPYWGPVLTFQATILTYILIGYSLISAVLPVWLILEPRDYLETFLKIGVIVGLAVGIVLLNPELKMSVLTQFIDGKWSRMER